MPSPRCPVRGRTVRLHAPWPAFCLFASACGFVAYDEAPLEPHATLARVVQARDVLPVPAELTLEGAAPLLATRNLAVRSELAELARARAVAAVRTPLPAPHLQVGPDIGVGSGIDTHRVVPFVALGLTIPLTGRRAHEDEVHAARAELARVNALTTFRSAWLELRRSWVATQLAQRERELRGTLVEGTARSLAAVRQLVDAGGASAFDVSLLAVADARARAELVVAERGEANARAVLHELLDVSLATPLDLADAGVPGLPALPPAAELLAEVADHHPLLLRARAEYLVAERALRLEIARQVPDLAFGPSFSGEVNESYGVLGLPLGLDLPLFARNQRGVAEADAARAAARVRYEVACSAALASLERARADVEFAARRLSELQENVLPLAATTADAAQRALAAGAGNAVALLEAQRALHEAELARHVARAELLAAWFTLESAVGRPLVDTGGIEYPPLPSVLAAAPATAGVEEAGS